ncbi:MAG TPA: PmoA family protein [Actinoplanes sp.]|nr:PmoA family protein [Actinoplanes sp.]
MTELLVDGTPVATYVTTPDVDIRLAPRPYLHPIRTLGGTVVTDEYPRDHPWHLGVSVTMQDVDGVNVWGGRTYVRDEGYIWRDDHGRVLSDILEPADGGFTEALRWVDGSDTTILTERRSVTARPATHGWELLFRYELAAPGESEVTVGSPATNGRTGGAGYGGFFWRATAGEAEAFVPSGGDPHGSTDPWLALTVGDAYTLVFRGIAGADRWFARTGDYNGVCAAHAWEDLLTIKPGTPLTRDISVLIADGHLTREEIAAL